METMTEFESLQIKNINFDVKEVKEETIHYTREGSDNETLWWHFFIPKELPKDESISYIGNELPYQPNKVKND